MSRSLAGAGYNKGSVSQFLPDVSNINHGRHHDLYTHRVHTVRWDGRLLGGHAKFEELVAELMVVFSDSTRLESRRVLVFWRASFSWISELHYERRWWGWVCNRGSIQ